ncbi:glucooligosaccharide oxidase [Mycena epipterygia]|nr:glucooligosaccharide oxidase [Mycena epipterygia]
MLFVCSLLFTFVSTLANHVSTASSSTLVSCLTGPGNGLKVELSQNSTWQSSTTPFNMRIQPESPSAIVYPVRTSDVSKAVKCAVKFGVHVSALSGGHSYSASGFGSNGTLVIMFRDMAQISYRTSDKTATVQPGARLGDVALALHQNGRALAHGVCPYVGVGGHAGFGGWGPASRNWGLLTDQIVSAVLVLADGAVVEVSETQNPSLFWGIRGAVSSFGVVTSYTFKTHQAPATVVRYSFTFNNPTLSADQFSKVLSSYQSWSLTAPKELGIEANVWQEGRAVELGGYYMGSLADFNITSASLLQATGKPDSTYVQERSWLDALVEVNGGTPLSTKEKPDIHSTFYAKSLVVPVDSLLTNRALSALATYWANTQIPDTLSWFIQFELWGGGNSVISSIPASATAYPHRAHLFTIQFYAYSSAAWPTQGTDFVDGLVNAITDNMPRTTFGAYANYLDPELADWQSMYYAGNYPRLAALQKKFDPRGVFLKAQNIGAPDL